MSRYNPFTDIGRYNLKNYIHKNKQTLTIVLVVAIFLVLVVMYVIYSGDPGESEAAGLARRPPLNLPPPRLGYGPYGYGMYLPPEAMVAEAVVDRG